MGWFVSKPEPAQPVPPGWHDAPDRPGYWRWWDGQQWTRNYHPKGPPTASSDGGGPAGTPVASWAKRSVWQRAVGEQAYADAFQRIVLRSGKRVGEEGTELNEIAASVVADPNNPHDSNAVAIWVLGELVGHLPRDAAARYSPPLRDLADQGHHLATTARVWAAPIGDGRGGSVTVMLPPAEGVQSFNEPPEIPHTVLPDGAAVQVGGEENHMDVLSRYVGDRDRHLAVTLHLVEEAKTERSTPYRCIEVRLDGHRVGVLAKGASEKLADVVEFVHERGRLPVARAVLKASPLRAEIVLNVAKSHEVTRRWLDSIEIAEGVADI